MGPKGIHFHPSPDKMFPDGWSLALVQQCRDVKTFPSRPQGGDCCSSHHTCTPTKSKEKSDGAKRSPRNLHDISSPLIDQMYHEITPNWQGSRKLAPCFLPSAPVILVWKKQENGRQQFLPQRAERIQLDSKFSFSVKTKKKYICIYILTQTHTHTHTPFLLVKVDYIVLTICFQMINSMAF